MPDLRMGHAEPAGGHGPLYSLGGIAPRVHPSAFIAPNAALIGNVEIGPEASVWFGAVIRADNNLIRIGARSNVQDGTIIHTDEPMPTTIGDDVTIGHAAIIHSCTLKDRAFVGMGATVLDFAVIEEGGVLGAGGLLAPNKVIGRRELWMGSPAKCRRVMDEAERQTFDVNATLYLRQAARYRAGLGR